MSEGAKVQKENRHNVRYQVWDIKCTKDGQKTFIKNLDAKGAIIICKEYPDSIDVKVEGLRTIQLDKLLRSRCIPYAVTGTEVSEVPTITRIRSHSIPQKISLKKLFPIDTIIDWNDFYPLDKIYSFLESLEKQFPSTCTVKAIGTTAEGRDIKMLKISNSDARNTAVWLDGAIHAREWISTCVVTYIADNVARHFSTLPKFMTNKDWYFVPVLNPDGYHYSHVSDRMWRKNRARFNKTIVGVDLNRNFGHAWGRSENSSSDPVHLNFRGTEPFSEPETTALKDVILYSGTPFKIFLTFHAYSEVIAFPWCYISDACPDYVALLEGAAIMAKAIYKTTGRMYKVGNFKDIMYYAAGTSIDWSYGTAHIPYSYLFELRSKDKRFLLPREEIPDCCQEVFNAVMALAAFVDKKECSNCTILAKPNRC